MNKYLLVRTDMKEITSSIYLDLKKAQKELIKEFQKEIIRQYQNHYNSDFDELEIPEYDIAELNTESAKLIEHDSDIKLLWKIIPVKVLTLDQFILIKTNGYTIETKLETSREKAMKSMEINFEKEKKTIEKERNNYENIFTSIEQETAKVKKGAITSYLWRIVKI